MKPLVCLLAVLVGLAGCSSDEASSDTVQTVKSSLARNTSPSLSAAEQDILAKGEASFAVDMLRAAAKTEGASNLFLSPHSISLALGMTYAGARGETAAEMKKVLHFDLPDERQHEGFNYLDLELGSRGLVLTNSLWAQKVMKLEAPFLDTLAVNYGSGVNVVDFAGDTESSRTTINGWVEKRTESRIRDLLKPGILTPNTRAVLVNATYFKAAWENLFTESATAPGSFTKLDSTTMSVPMMRLGASVPYAKGEGYEAVALPYDGNGLSLLVVVPDVGTYVDFESELTGPKMLDVYAGLQPTAVSLAFPKLKLESALSLKRPLGELGMRKAFAGADFSGLSPEPLVVTEVVHQTFLVLDEEGTEAAAATAAVVGRKSASGGDGATAVNVDRPFLVGIVDAKTKTLVFLGRVLEPTGS